MVSHSAKDFFYLQRSFCFAVLFVCLLSRSTLTFLAQYMNYERQQNIEKCRTKPLFLRTCYEKVHWIETVLDAKNDEAISLCHPEVYHHLRLARLILNINKKSYKESVWWAELEGIDGEFLEPESAMSLCHVELLRQMNISKFLLPICSFNDQVFHKNLLFNQFLTLQIDFSIESYEKIRILLALNHQHNQQQFTMIQNPQILPRTEVDLLNEYMIVKLYLNILQSPEPTQQFLDSHLQHIRVLLKAINDGNVLFQLLQIVFTLLFLRFEHIRKTKRRRKNSEAQSGSFSMHNNSTDVSDTTVDTLQNGFVCLKTSLKSVLNSIRLFLMGLEQMEVYETCDEELKEKFGRFLGNVDNALWRLQIVESEIVEKSKSERSVKEWIEFYEQKAAIEVTSDEEKNSPKKKVNRKKLKKRPKNVVNSDDNDEASDDPVEYQLVTETSLDNSEVRTQSRSTESQRRLRSVISKVIMSPESLVAMCMLNGDEKNVQKVIKVREKIKVFETSL